MFASSTDSTSSSAMRSVGTVIESLSGNITGTTVFSSFTDVSSSQGGTFCYESTLFTVSASTGITQKTSVSSSLFVQTNSSVRSFGSTNSTVFRTTLTAQTVNGVTASGSTTAQSVGTDVLTYSATTQTTTSAGTITQTTTSTRSSTFISSTAAGASASSSSADTYTQTATATAAISFTTYQTSSFVAPNYFNTIVRAISNDWVWKVTTTGTGPISAVGVSLTASTFTEQGIVSTAPVSYFNVSQQLGTATITFTRPRFVSTTITSTTRTSTTSTYNVARSGAGQATPYTNTTAVVTISYTSARPTTLTYSSTNTSSVTNSTFSTIITWSSPVSSTAPTTWANGTFAQTYTWLSPANTSVIVIFTGINVVAGPGITDGGATNQRTTYGVSVLVSRSNVQNVGSSNMMVDGITIAEGFQALPSHGRTQPIGTNISVTPNSTVTSMGFGWLPSVRAPLGTSASSTTTVTTSTTTQASTATTTVLNTMNIAGAVPQTLRNTRTTSKFAGYGWVSTDGITASLTAGAHSLTTCIDGTTGTTTIQWFSTASTHSFSSGVAVAAETIPLMSSTLSSSHAPVTNFQAFPST